MGYEEIYCHLCGVSFNIGRHRKPGESDMARWDYSGDHSVPTDFRKLYQEECAQDGCLVVVRSNFDDEDDVPEDPDYVPPDEDDYDEPEEYDSEFESSDSMSICQEDGMKGSDDGSERTEIDDDYSAWLARTLHPRVGLRGEPVGSHVHLRTDRPEEKVLPIQSVNLIGNYEPEDLEHIPSRTCWGSKGYSGFAISLEEMRGCRTVQFLIHKSQADRQWEPDEINENWETSEDWFLSGLRDGSSADDEFSEVWPAQRGVSYVQAGNFCFDPDEISGEEVAMPFHPWCFDIFCRQSKKRFNCINVSGLMEWRNSNFSWDDFYEFPRSDDVLECREQWWLHASGTEYLAANPLYVPGWEKFLLDAAEIGEESEPPHEEVGYSNPGKYDRAASQADHADPFASMPPEIRLLIVSYLKVDDINNLRIASRAFTTLPNSLWWRLVREEMPWLWESEKESEEVHQPSYWTSVTASDLIFLKQERERYLSLLGEDQPSRKKMVEFLLPLPEEIPNQLRLPKQQTNWHRLYTHIKRNWSRLKGLQNRKRIWEDVEWILDRIEEGEKV